MKTISFSCVEKLQKLLSRECCQTIRPMTKCNCPQIRCGKCNDYDGYNKPRLNVGDICKIYWKQRSSPKGSWFIYCHNCGSLMEFVSMFIHGIEIDKKKLWKNTEPCAHCEKYKTTIFPKLLGTVKITEVFEIEMCNPKYFDFAAYDKGEPSSWVGNITQFGWVKNFGDNIDVAEDFAEKDGFKSVENMFNWFDKKHDLSTPKRFAVYRFKYIN